MMLIDKISIFGKFLIAAGSCYLLGLQVVVHGHQIHEFIHSLSHSALSGGFLSGTLHALTGPDHMAILLPLIFNKQWYYSCIYGVVWGCGHGVTSVVINTINFAMKSYVVDLSDLFVRYRFVMDGVVGLTLVVIGLMGIAESKGEPEGEDEDKSEDKTAAKNNHCDIENMTITSDIQRDNTIINSSSEITPTSSTTPLFAYLALFVNGAVLGVSWDGLPSLAPGVVLDDSHSLSLFLAAYLMGTMLAMGTAAGAVGQVTYFISHRMNNNTVGSNSPSRNTSIGSIDSSDITKPSSSSPHISSHLAHMSSLVSCVIGSAWVLLAGVKYAISIMSDNTYNNNNMNNVIGNDGTSHIHLHHFINEGVATSSEEVFQLQHSRDHVFQDVSHSHYEINDRIYSHLDVMFSVCSVLLILIVMFVTIGREYHIIGSDSRHTSGVAGVIKSIEIFARRLCVYLTSFCTFCCHHVEKNKAYTV